MAHYVTPSSQLHSSRLIKIVATETIENYTVYIIELSIGSYKWQVQHRYSEFYDLHEKLVSKYKVEKQLLPPKKLFGNQSDSFIRKRQGDLEVYLQTLLISLQTVPDELAQFLHFNTYEIHGIVQSLAEKLFHRGDSILQTEEIFTITNLQLHALTTRLKLAEPTCETGDVKKDIGHVLDFVTRVKYAKITGQLEQLGASNILMNDLTFDLNMFKALESLEINFCNPEKISAVDTIKKTLKNLKVLQTVNHIKDMLLVDAALAGHWLGADQEAVLVPVWTALTVVDFSFNHLKEIDQSVKLIPNVEYLNLSHNGLHDIHHLDTLSSLTHLDLSHNAIHSLDSLHTKLGNIKTLNLSDNKLQTLQGFCKLYSLEKLDVRNNEISQVLDVRFVSGLPCLESLRLNGNPVTIVLDYRTKILELFKERAKEITLDGKKANQKELDTVAILLAMQKSKEAREKGKKHRKQPRDAPITDLYANSPGTSLTQNISSGQSTPRSSTPLGMKEHALDTSSSASTREVTLNNPGGLQATSSRRTDLVDRPGQLSLSSNQSSETLGSFKASSEATFPGRTSSESIRDPAPSGQGGKVMHRHITDTAPSPQSGKQKPHIQSGNPDLVTRPKQKRRQAPKLGYQFSIYESMEAPKLPGGSMLPETLPSRSDATFMAHLQELLPNTGALARMSRTREERREHQEEKTIHVMWCSIISYTQPFRESMACVCVTTENLHLLEVKTLRGAAGMPKLVHRNCIPLVNIQQIVLGNERQYIRVEEAFVGPQGTYTLLTGSMAKTDLFLDSMKQAYRRAISDLDQYEDPHILANPETVPNLKATLNVIEHAEESDSIDVALYMLVNAIDYSKSSRPFTTHSLVMTSQYLYLLQEDYILWPQATFAIGMPTRTQFVLSCAFPIDGKISGIQMYDSDTYSPDQDTSLSQTFSATKSCAMVVPNFIGYGVMLIFDMGSLGPQTLDIRVPTSGLRDKFLATLTNLRRKLSERLPSPHKYRHHHSSRLKEADADSLSTNSGGSRHGARPKYHKHSSAKHRHKYTKMKFSGARPDILPDLKQSELAPEMAAESRKLSKQRESIPYEHLSTESNRSSESNTSYREAQQDVDSESTSDFDSSDAESGRHLSQREAPTGESDISDSSSSELRTDNELETKESLDKEDLFKTDCDKDNLIDDSDDLTSSSISELSTTDASDEDIDDKIISVRTDTDPHVADTHLSQTDTEPAQQHCPQPTNFGLSDSVSSTSTNQATPHSTPKCAPKAGVIALVEPQFSLDIQYPSMGLLAHLTECNGEIQLLQPLSDIMRTLASMEADELVNFFHSSVAQIGQTSEELRHVLWTPVIPYTKHHTELVSCIMLSTKAIYFVSDVKPPASMAANKDWKTHSRNKSDSYRFLATGRDMGSDMHLSSGVIHHYKWTSMDQQKVPRTYAVLQLKDVKQVTVGLFDQSFRLVGPSAESTYVCMTRDHKLTGKFTNVLTSVLAVARPTPSPDLPSSEMDPEQDFYSMFNNYTRNESNEYKHSSKVAFVYPSEDVIKELLFVFSDSIKDQKHEVVHHFLAYIMVFSIRVKASPTRIPTSTVGAHVSLQASSASLEPRTLMVTEKHLALGEEDVVHYPIPDFAFGPPAEPRYRILEVRRIEDLKKIHIDKDPHIVTLVFADEPDIVVNAQFDHYTNYGGRVPRHVTPMPEARYKVAIPNLHFKSKLLNVLRKQWAELHDDGELSVLEEETT